MKYNNFRKSKAKPFSLTTVFSCSPILILAIATFYSCKNFPEKEATQKTAHIVEEKGIDNIAFDTSNSALVLSKYSRQINYIPLKNTTDAFIGEVTKIESFENIYCVLDKRYAKAVFVFNNKGELLYKKKANSDDLLSIDKISDIAIDRFNKRLVLFANEEQKILSIDLISGRIKNITKVQDYFVKLRVIDENHYMLLRDGLAMYKGKVGEYRICIVDFSGTVKQKYFNTALNDKINVGTIYSSNGFDGRILIARMLSDTIWSYHEGKIRAIHKIKSPFVDVSYLQNAATKNEAERALLNPLSHYISSDIFETDSLIGFKLKGDNSVSLGLWNKKQNTRALYKYVKNDIDQVPMSVPIFIDKTRFISIISLQMLQQYYSLLQKSNPGNLDLGNIKRTIEKYQGQTNPILAEIVLK